MPHFDGYLRYIEPTTGNWVNRDIVTGTKVEVEADAYRFVAGNRDIITWGLFITPTGTDNWSIHCESGLAKLVLELGMEQKKPEEDVQTLLNMLADQKHIQEVCRKLGQHGMALYSEVPKLNPSWNTVRTALDGGYITIQSNVMKLTHRGLFHADTTPEGFNSRSWHGWTR